MPAVFVVGNLDDAGPGSLRDAIELANATSGDDEIQFAVVGSINIASQLPTITEGLTITGPGADHLTIDAGDGADGLFGTGDGHRIFDIDDGDDNDEIVVSISGLTLTGGDTADGTHHTPDFSGVDGGAIRSHENLTLIDARITGNATGRGADGRDGGEYGGDGGNGGGIFMRFGDLTLIRSTISGNRTGDGGHGADGGPGPGGFGGFGGRGGGIASVSDKVTIVDSTISGNVTGNGGEGGYGYDQGGVFYDSPSGDGGRGGGVAATRLVEVINSTISGNVTGAGGMGYLYGFQGEGGGVFSYGPVLAANSTITENQAAYGGGIRTWNALTLSNSIVAGNGTEEEGDSDLSLDSSTLTVNYTLIGDTNSLTVQQKANVNMGVGNLLDVDPLLAPLADNGGPTPTHALLANSPAIDAGDPAIAFDASEFDQRGAPFTRVFDYPQVVGAGIDMGAYEARPPESGDFDDDGQVGAEDFTAWQGGFGTHAGAMPLQGDGDFDGDVDGRDFLIWQRGFIGGNELATASQAPTVESHLADAFTSAENLMLADMPPELLAPAAPGKQPVQSTRFDVREMPVDHILAGFDVRQAATLGRASQDTHRTGPGDDLESRISQESLDQTYDQLALDDLVVRLRAAWER